MKRNFLKAAGILSIIAMVGTGLAACGSSDSGSSDAAASSAAASSAAASSADASSAAASSAAEASSADDASADDASAGGKKMAIMMHSVADDFIYCCGKHAQDYAEAQGYEVTFLDAKNEPDTQASQVEDVLSGGYDAIILAPVDADALSDSVAKINEAGIPVTLLDRGVTEGAYVSLNQANNVDCGYEGAQLIASQAEKYGIAVEDLKVLELQGMLSSGSGRERTEGFQKGAEELGLNVVSSLPTDWDSEKAYNATLDALQADPDINAIFCASDGVMADSVTQALDQLQLLKSNDEEGHIIIVTVDGTPGVIQYIKDGMIDAAASQPAFDMAEGAVDYLTKALNGEEEIEACVDNSIAPTEITIDNVDDDTLWGNNV
ncbi:MAG: sugar ABC transporter substrate-binding protein [Eubacterium sp.]|nr:sugar ABC transporter substrate-binding protein [Eubacterium sp.]